MMICLCQDARASRQKQQWLDYEASARNQSPSALTQGLPLSLLFESYNYIYVDYYLMRCIFFKVYSFIQFVNKPS